MSILFSSKPWDKKVYSFNYFDLPDSDSRKADLDKYFVGKTRQAVVKSDRLIKKAPRSVT
jgi:hypothetical protein